MEPDSCRGLDHPKFKVNRRSIRDRLIMTFLITKLKAKIRHKKNATGNTCEETELNQALEEIMTGEVYEKRKKERNTGKVLWNV